MTREDSQDLESKEKINRGYQLQTKTGPPKREDVSEQPKSCAVEETADGLKNLNAMFGLDVSSSFYDNISTKYKHF